MGRSRFPGKPYKFQNRKRISVLSGTVFGDDNAIDSFPGSNDDAESSTNSTLSDCDDNKKSDHEEASGCEVKTFKRRATYLERCSSEESSQSSDSSKDIPSSVNMEQKPITIDNPKPVKKTVTFGTVESCEDTFQPLKKLPSKNQVPLVSIIKKKKTDSIYRDILKPAILTDLSSKVGHDSSDSFTGVQPSNSFSQLSMDRKSPPLYRKTPLSRHSSRIIKPNKKFSDFNEIGFKKSVAFEDERQTEKEKLKFSMDCVEDDDENEESDASWESSSSFSSVEADRPSSQLLNRKVIIREARLQLNSGSTLTPEGPFSSSFTNSTSVPMGTSLSPTSTTGAPTTVTCGVCGAVRFYKFVKQARKFGIYSCESCRKFISKMVKKEKVSQNTTLHCLKGEGNCQVPPIVRSQQWKLARCSNKTRCPACWLKLCLKAFQVPPNTRAGLEAMLPVFMRSGKVADIVACKKTLPTALKSISPVEPFEEKTEFPGSIDGGDIKIEKSKPKELLSVEKKIEKKKHEHLHHLNSRKRRLSRIKVRKKEPTEEKPEAIADETIRQKVELKGPRVKHVCRSASIVLGQPIATFPTQDEKSMIKEQEESSSDDDLPKLEIDDKENCFDSESEEALEKNEPCSSETQSEKYSEIECKRRKTELEEKAIVKVVPSISQEMNDVKKALAKPLTNIVNTRIPCRSAKMQQGTQGLISIDFWESYDLDEVCNSGFGIISSAPFTVNSVCFLCGSKGQEQLVYCWWCSEGIHRWCAESAGGAGGASGRISCPRCVRCNRCGRPAARSRCTSCSRHYHAACLRAHPSRGDWPQICTACLKCKSCDSTKIRKFVGSVPFCASCFRLRQKGNYCPLCQGCYQDNDFDSKMMECGLCSRWVHASCEGLSGEEYQLLSALPPSIEYTCKQCTPDSPKWMSLLRNDLKDRLLSLLKGLAKNRKACTLLKLTPHKNTPNREKLKDFYAVRKLTFEDRIEGSSVEENNTPATVFRAYSRRVINLQEPLMQNKEICFYDIETEHVNSCVQVKENNPNFEMSQNYMDRNVDNNQEGIDKQDSGSEVVRSLPTESPSLLDIKKKVNSDEYKSLKDFNSEIKEVIYRTLSSELKVIYKKLFGEIFPWFDCENNCVNAGLEVEYENETDTKEDLQVCLGRKEKEPPIQEHQNNVKFEEIYVDSKDIFDFEQMSDSRACILCKVVGDGSSHWEGRLLYAGQNEWIHINCALWSAEVFEEIDGSLQNVSSAISRGKMIKCASCESKGASVGCCAKNCSETYHYACARKGKCAFLDDKRVFCPNHTNDLPKKCLQKEEDFEMNRPVYIELDRKRKRFCEISKIEFLLGSLTVKSLGKIVPCVSDFEDYLIPVDFVGSRLFWSTKKPFKIVRYNIRTKISACEPTPGFDTGVNITVDHSCNSLIVERIMAEINAWHKNLETALATVKMLKKDKDLSKSGSVSLEELAVKQVMEHLLDCVSRQEQDEEEPQNTADLLPPELKDAIFEDLNHDVLDGISMLDIIPKLMYEDLVGIDHKNEIFNSLQEDGSRNTPDFIDELMNAKLEPGSRELKRSKTDHSPSFKNRVNQKTSWNNKLDSNLLSSTIKRFKGARSIGNRSTATVTELKSSDGNEKTKKSDENLFEQSSTDDSNERTSESFEQYAEGSKEKDEDGERKNEYYTGVIDFYTKIQCSPISQLDGACDEYNSDSSSRSSSPVERQFTPIPQLDGVGESSSSNEGILKTIPLCYQGKDASYTVTIASGNMMQQEMVLRAPMDEMTVRCDRCHCTYRNKEMYDRHLPTCDTMSTSESESENPKSPDGRTLTTLQNAFNATFTQPLVLSQGIGGSELKPDTITARRSSTNTRQITINGTIVETASNSQDINMLSDQVKGTVTLEKTQSISTPQLVVAPQQLIPPKSVTPNNSKVMNHQMINTSGILPYNICMKPNNTFGNGNNEVPQLIAGPGGIQAVITSNGNQVLTFPANQQIVQGKGIQNFSNVSLPVNSLQGLPSGSIIQNIQPMMRQQQIQGNPTIVVPALTSQTRPQLILPHLNQKSPKKPQQVQPKPIFQSGRGRGRTLTKNTTTKRQVKIEKTIQPLNQTLGNNTLIHLQTNNQSGQPSIIVQPVPNQNIMTAYMEALSQQNQNVQYIATIAPQSDFKTAPTQFLSQGNLMPQAFQIQQTENGSLVAVPSGGIPILLPQGNVGVIPQTLQPGTLIPQGALQQGIMQGINGHTILPSNLNASNATILQPNLQHNTIGLQAQGAVVSQSGIGGAPQAIVSQAPGTILPQFCNDQVILGSTPELQMVTDSSGCMYLTAAQPLYYGLETIVQNTVMQSQQFVSTAMQGVLAQNSSFSATTTQVFQASKIEPIVEMPAGYVVVNADNSNQGKPNITLQAIADNSNQGKPNITLQAIADKTKQPPPAKMVQTSTENMRASPAVSSTQLPMRSPSTMIKPGPSSSGQSSMSTFTLASSGESIPISQPIISSTIAPSIIKPKFTINSPHTFEIGPNNDNIQTINTSLKSPNIRQNINLDCKPLYTSSCDSSVTMPKLTVSSGGINVIPANFSDKPHHNHIEPKVSKHNQINLLSGMSLPQNMQHFNTNVVSMSPMPSNNVIHITSGNLSHYAVNNEKDKKQMSLDVAMLRSEIATGSVRNVMNQNEQRANEMKHEKNSDVHLNICQTMPKDHNQVKHSQEGNINLNANNSGVTHTQTIQNMYSANVNMANPVKNANISISNVMNQRIELNANMNENMHNIPPKSICPVPSQTHTTTNMSNLSQPDQQHNMSQNSVMSVHAHKTHFDMTHTQDMNMENQMRQEHEMRHTQMPCQQAISNDQQMQQQHHNMNQRRSNDMSHGHHQQQQLMMVNNQIHTNKLVVDEGTIQLHLGSNTNNGNMRPMDNLSIHTLQSPRNSNKMMEAINNSHMHQMNTMHGRQFDNMRNENDLSGMMHHQQMSCGMNMHQQMLNQGQMQKQSPDMDNNMVQMENHQNMTNMENQLNMGGQQNLDAINIGIQSMNVVNQLPHTKPMDINQQMCMPQHMTLNNGAEHMQMKYQTNNMNLPPTSMGASAMKNDSCHGNCNNMNSYQNIYPSCSNPNNLHPNNNNMNNQIIINTSNTGNVQNANTPMVQNSMYMPNSANTGNNMMMSCSLNNDCNMGMMNMMTTNASIPNPQAQMNMSQMMNSGNQVMNQGNQLMQPTLENISVSENKFYSDNTMGKMIQQNAQSCPNIMSMQHMSEPIKPNAGICHNEKPPMPQMDYMQMNKNINLPERPRNIPTMMPPPEPNMRLMNENQRNIMNENNMMHNQRNENTTTINVPLRAIPNNAPMNINVNSSNNTVNITVQNNLVDPKIVGKTNQMDYTVQNNTMMHNQVNTPNMVCVPLQNNTINIPNQSSYSISLPKAPPSHPSGIPTNVVNPISTRPMSRVLPLHRGQNKVSKPVAQPKPIVPIPQTSTTPAPPPVAPIQTHSGQDMPDLNFKDETMEETVKKADTPNSEVKDELNVDIQKPNEELTMLEDSFVENIPPVTPEPIVVNKRETSPLPTLCENIPPPNVLIEKPSVSSINKTINAKSVKRTIDGEKKLSSTILRKNSLRKIQESSKAHKPPPQSVKEEGPKLIFEVSSDDGFSYTSTSLTDLWSKVLEAVQSVRKQAGIDTGNLTNMCIPATHILGLHNKALRYLIQQLPGASRCTKYKSKHGSKMPLLWDNDDGPEEWLKESAWGCARAGPVQRTTSRDTFSWLASPYRDPPPPFVPLTDADNHISRRLTTLPLAMRFRNLKETAKATLGVYRSTIHGRGLFCKRDIDEGEMVIEYAGEVIRAVLADRREQRYEARGAHTQCYMFRVDDRLVVDATLKGNAARFINHSCDPNCYSKVVDIHGHKHILIFALRRIAQGEELTYDYKFPFEEDKIPCSCGAKKCRKYLN